MSWTAIKNGELLTLGLKYFDAFVTTDRNLSLQQNLASFSIAVIVVRTTRNHVAYLRPLVPSLLAIVESAQRRTASIVGPLKNRTLAEFVDEYPGASTARVYGDWSPTLDRSIGKRRVG